jgi:DNA-binding XRE family transcriptional regulator
MTTATQDLMKSVRGVRLAESGAGRSIRLAAGVSQEAVAKAVGVSPAAIGLWELGQRIPQTTNAARYFDAIAALQRASKV